MKTIKDMTDDELRAELARRGVTAKQNTAAQRGVEYAAKVPPVGKWHVTTEGDCEGRTTRDLGYHEGHIADIALNLAGSAYYSLSFRPAEPSAVLLKPGNEANVTLPVESGTWAMAPEERVAFFRAYLGAGGKPKNAGSVAVGTYHASVTIRK